CQVCRGSQSVVTRTDNDDVVSQGNGPLFRLTPNSYYTTVQQGDRPLVPPASLHERFEAALARVRETLGQTHANFIAGTDRMAQVTHELRTPIDRNVV